MTKVSLDEPRQIHCKLYKRVYGINFEMTQTVWAKPAVSELGHVTVFTYRVHTDFKMAQFKRKKYWAIFKSVCTSSYVSYLRHRNIGPILLGHFEVYLVCFNALS